MSDARSRELAPGVLADGPRRRFGLGRVINGAGALSRLGGALVEPEVAAAMAQAAQQSVDVWQLQAAASERIAFATGAEAGLVTTGASASLTLAAAATLAGHDVARMMRLPDAGDGPDEIVLPRTHRNGYDRALVLAGAKLVEVGVDDIGTGAGVRGLEAWEVEAALGPRTAALFASGAAPFERDLAILAETARRARLPLIVDAAAQLPPRENLRRYVGLGASLVAFSGGKALGGPQGSGILAGTRRLIASAALQTLDMDVRPEAFRAPPAFFPNGAPPVLPRHGIGRGFKASKEAVVGLLVALERFLAADPASRVRATQARLHAVAGALAGVPGLALRREPPPTAERHPRLVLAVDPEKAGLDASALAARLGAMDPAVHLGEGRVADGLLVLDLSCVAPADDEQLVWSIRAALSP